MCGTCQSPRELQDLGDLVAKDFEIRRLANKKIVIAKLVKQKRWHQTIKKKQRELSQHKNNLKSTKRYVNESLCPYYCKLLGKCNSLLKKNQLKYFYTINGKLKISYDSHSGEVSAVITHNRDLLEIFGSEMMS